MIMKKLYSTMMMFAMIVAALGFTACGGDSDDDEVSDGIKSSSLIGTWEPYSPEGAVTMFIGDFLVEADVAYTQFKSNHTYIIVNDYHDYGVDIFKGEWTLSNNVLTLKETEGDTPGFSWSYTILKLENNRMDVSTLASTFHLKKVSDSKIQKYLK